jgi:hypothetical protein
MNHLEDFKSYSKDDFILDEEFREIVRKSASNNRLKELLESLPDKEHEINLAVEILHGLHPEPIHQSNQRKHELWQEVLQQRKKRRFLPYFLKIAASLLLIVSAVFFYEKNQKPKVETVVVNELPSNNAKLILAGGKTVLISNQQSTVQYTADGSGIMINDSAGVVQSVSGEGFNQMIVPYGKRSSIILSDGTKVWLNSGSKLVFPPVFKGKSREVELEGEGLFEVTKNAEKPFYVKTDAFRLKVYGTKFNVQAYVKDEEYNVVLVEGKVSMNLTDNLKETFLCPNQKASLPMGSLQFEIKNVENTEVYTAWVDGYLTFTNEKVRDVLQRVARYYNVPVESVLPEGVPNIYGKLDLKDDLKRVLDGIAFISKTKYEQRGNKYVFHK